MVLRREFIRDHWPPESRLDPIGPQGGSRGGSQHEIHHFRPSTSISNAFDGSGDFWCAAVPFSSLSESLLAPATGLTLLSTCALRSIFACKVGLYTKQSLRLQLTQLLTRPSADYHSDPGGNRLVTCGDIAAVPCSKQVFLRVLADTGHSKKHSTSSPDPSHAYNYLHPTG